MTSKFLPVVSLSDLNNAYSLKDYDTLYDLLAQPLHEELFARGSFEFLDELSPGQQLMLTYDYVRTQVGQGGFIQFIENGYVGLLPAMVAQLYMVAAAEMAEVFDDVLKVYVLNKDMFSQPNTVESFARLYDELKEFEMIDKRFAELNEVTIRLMIGYAMAHLQDFVAG
jgi:hypothetical protein